VVIVPFQAFADGSPGGIVERHVQCILNLQQSVALFNELWEQKLINNFSCCLQQH